MNTINTREDRYHLLGRRFKGWGIEYLWGEAQGLGLRKILLYPECSAELKVLFALQKVFKGFFWRGSGTASGFHACARA